MDKQYTQSKRKPWIWPLVIFAALVTKGLISGGAEAYRQATSDPAAVFDQQIATDTRFGSMFAAFRTSYPPEYEDFRRQAIEKIRDKVPAAELRTFASDWMRRFMASHATDVAQAPHENLEAFRRAQIEVADAFAKNSPQSCAHVVLTGLQAQDPIPPDVAPLLGKQVELQFEASAAGRHTPVQRVVDRLSDQDSAALAREMNYLGVSTKQMQLLASDQLGTAPEAEQCEVGVKLLRAVAALPTDQTDRVTGYMITHQ